MDPIAFRVTQAFQVADDGAHVLVKGEANPLILYGTGGSKIAHASKKIQLTMKTLEGETCGFPAISLKTV